MNSGNRTFIPTSQSEYFSLDALRPFYALNEMRDKKDFDGLYDLFQDYQEAIGEIQYFIRWQVVAPSIALRACSLRQVWLIERIAPSLECTLTGPTQFFVTSLKLTLCVPLEKHWG